MPPHLHPPSPTPSPCAVAASLYGTPTQASGTAEAAFCFDNVVSPADLGISGDTRELAVAFHSLTFVDQAGEPIGHPIVFGTSEANALQTGNDWFGNETDPDQGTFQWAGDALSNDTDIATLQIDIPAGTEGLFLSPNPPMDRDGRREDSGRGEGVTGAMIRARIWVDGRLAGGLQALLGAPMAAYSGCGERDGGIGHGKRRSRTGLARVCGDVGLAGGSVADGRRQAGSGMARSRARARLNCSSQGQRRGRCRVNRRAERVIRPAKAKTRRLRVLVVTIC